MKAQPLETKVQKIRSSIRIAHGEISMIERIPPQSRTWHEKVRLKYAKATVTEGTELLKKMGAW